ncbi:MAG: DUF6122 family protein [Acidiferrobacterales bacterium]
MFEFRPLMHIFLHFAVPGVVARLGFKATWKKAWLIMAATILVDLDHVLANPLFDPNRCSIGFHPLHTYYAIGVYVVMALMPKSRLIGIGLLIHMALDATDCFSIGAFS